MGTALRERAPGRCSRRPMLLPSGFRRRPTPAPVGLPGLQVMDPSLHLDVAVRQIRNSCAAAWVGAVLRAIVISSADFRERWPVPFLLTRDVDAMRDWLRCGNVDPGAGIACEFRRQGLRAEGLGCELPHMDAGAVARWFLDRWPDVRAPMRSKWWRPNSPARAGTRSVGLCWDGDLIRAAGGWRPRNFVGKSWQIMKKPERIANQINSYRVLLTRARYDDGDLCSLRR